MLNDSTTITVTNSIGQSRSYVWGQLDDATKLRAVEYGLREANTDSYAGATKEKFPDPAVRLAEQKARADARDESIRNGTWAAGQSGRGSAMKVMAKKVAEAEKENAELRAQLAAALAATPPVEHRKGKAA